MSSHNLLAVPMFAVISAMMGLPCTAGDLKEADVRLLIEKFGPVLYMHPDEKYKLDNPEDILGRSRLVYGIVNESQLSEKCHTKAGYNALRISHVGEIRRITARTFMREVTNVLENVKPQPPYDNSPDFRCWIEYDDSLKAGHSEKAEALVQVLPVDVGDSEFTEILFWFYYPFNGPGHLWYRLASGIGMGDVQ